MSRSLMVELGDVRHSYLEGAGRRTVLNGLDLQVPTGEMLALVGRSGSGKSTLLNLISGIDRPDQGRIEVANQRLEAMDERGRTLLRRRRIGFVFQFFNLLPTLTVAENLRLPLQLNQRNDEAASKRIELLLHEVDLGGYGHRFPDTLSGGEQQRVAVARALIHQPDLILADEPTGNLDVDTGNHVFSVLERLVRGAGKTLIMVTHSTELASRADRVLHLRKGRLHGEASA
ncbi:MAG: ABC transporter ATP-binding protein [Pseudomonadota bacterium]|nr:ABC transporter ATP-binding protein [Pseudomonadota bacterium]